MTKSIVKGYTDTPVDGFPALSIPGAPLNWAENFGIVQDDPGSVELRNLTTPYGMSEAFRFAQRIEKNVYGSNFDGDPSSILPNKQGIRTSIVLNDIWKVTDSTDATYEKALPMMASLSYVVPMSDVVDSDDVAIFLFRLLAGLFEQGSSLSDGINNQLHGVLLKKAFRG